MRATFAAVSLCVALGFLAACGGGTEADVVIPDLVVHSPSTNVVLPLLLNNGVNIEYTDTDTTGLWTTEVLADRDGFLRSENDQVVIEGTRPAGTGERRSIRWSMNGVWSGSYVVYVRMRYDGREITARAPGRVTLDVPPTFQIREPDTQQTVSRGGFLCVNYISFDSETVPTIDLRLDVDGLFLTEADAYPLPVPPPSPVYPDCEVVSVGTTPEGLYRLIGRASDHANPPVEVQTPHHVQVANLSYARALGPASTEGTVVVYDTDFLPDGSSLLVGWALLSTTFARGELNETVLGEGGFLARYNANGSLRWARSLGQSDDEAELVGGAVLSDGSVVATGVFRGNLTVDPGLPTETHLFSIHYGAFVARFDEDGALLWVNPIESSNEERGVDVAAFGDGTALVAHTVSSASLDTFVRRLRDDGTVVWTRRIPGSAALRVETAPDGSWLAYGSFSGLLILGLGEARERRLVSQGTSDMFLAHFAANGTLNWAVQESGTGGVVPRDVAVGPNGSIAVSGQFTGSVNFASGLPTEAPHNSAGANDGFVSLYSGDGTLLWSHRIGSPVSGGAVFAGEDLARGCDFMPDGSVVVCGVFQGPLTVEGRDNDRFVPSSSIAFGAFLVRYTSDGDVLDLRTDGDLATHQIGYSALGVANDGSCVLFGDFWQQVTFGAGEAQPVSLDAAAQGALFLTRINADFGY